MNLSTLLFRRAGIRLFDTLGINRLLQRRFAGCGVALMLHRVVERPSDTIFPGMAIDVSFLGEALREFRRLGFDFVRASEVLSRLTAASGAPFVCVTLDDGYRDNLEVALPLFQECHVPFTVYPTVGFIQDDGTAPAAARSIPSEKLNVELAALEHLLGNRKRVVIGERSVSIDSGIERRMAEQALSRHVRRRHGPASVAYDEVLAANGTSLADALRAAYLTWSQLRKLASEPLAEIGAHGLTHQSFAALDETTASEEIERPRAILSEALGVPIRSIAYPFGSPSAAGPREFALAEQAGYDVGFTTVRANLHPEHAGTRLRLPRLGLSLAPHGRSVGFVRGLARGGQHAVLNRFRRFVV